MRVLGFSERWNKLDDHCFTTFRFPRKDKDWQVGEVVQLVFKPRSPKREILGTATIVSIEKVLVLMAISNREAVEVGFTNIGAFQKWMVERYPLKRLQEEPMNKLTLRRLL